MTTLDNRPKTALLVIDVQNGVVNGNHERDAVVANVGSLVEKARRERVPVVWVQHSDDGLARGSDEWRIVPELTPSDAEPLVEKSYGDSFEDTNLETVLSGLGVGRLVVVGAQTDACIRSTLHGALVRGYDETLVSDAHTTVDQSAWAAHLLWLVGQRRFDVDRSNAEDRGLVEEAFGHAIEGNRAWQQRLGADVAKVEQQLGVVHRLPQPPADLYLCGKALIRGQNVDLGPRDVRVQGAHGLSHPPEDNSPAARIGRVELGEARARIHEHSDMNAFIALSAEIGGGTVVAVKDLVDVAGAVTAAGGMILPPTPATGAAPGIK